MEGHCTVGQVCQGVAQGAQLPVHNAQHLACPSGAEDEVVQPAVQPQSVLRLLLIAQRCVCQAYVTQRSHKCVHIGSMGLPHDVAAGK